MPVQGEAPRFGRLWEGGGFDWDQQRHLDGQRQLRRKQRVHCQLDGASGWVDFPNSTLLNPTGPFSVECWINGSPSQSSSEFLVVDKSHGFVDSAGWAMQELRPERCLFYGLGGGGTVNFIGPTSTNRVLDNRWHHLAGVWTGTQVQLFVDIMQAAVASSRPSRQQPAGFGQFLGWQLMRYFNGLVDEVSYYSRALSSSEVQSIYNAGSVNQARLRSLPPFTGFFTLGPNLQYVAVYTAQNILPLLKTVAVNFANPVPATTNLLLTLQFDRTMLTDLPIVLLTNSAPGAAAIQPVPANGFWTSTAFADTYHPPITIGSGMDGTLHKLFVSGAVDLNAAIGRHEFLLADRSSHP